MTNDQGPITQGMTKAQKSGRRGAARLSAWHLGFWRWDFLGHLGLGHWAFRSVAAWFVFGGGFSSVAQPGALLWSFNAGEMIISSPALSPGGTIYIETEAGLHALTNGGSNGWTFPVSQTLACSPAIGSDGTIYLGGNHPATFYAVNPDGTTKWSYSLQPEFPYQITYASSPAIATDGTLYFVASGRLYALSAAGAKKWEFLLDDDSSTPVHAVSPSIGPDGTIYALALYSGVFYAVNPDGTQRWQIPLGSFGDSAIAADGTIVVACGLLNAVSPMGNLLWRGIMSDGCSPVIGSNGAIYAANSTNYSLYAMSRAGQVSWMAGSGYNSINSAPPTTAAIDAGGMLYYSSSNVVFAITSQGTVQWTFASAFAGSFPNSPATYASPAIGPDGTIYAAFGNVLYAIQGSGKPLGTTPWPMYRQNLRHTGKVEKPSLAPPKKRADANFDIQLAGEIGQAYSVQSTSNFLNWTSVTSFVATSLPMSVADLTASNAPNRFYRATTP